MQNEDNNLVFAFTIAFVLHLVFIAIYDMATTPNPEAIEPRIVKIRLGNSSDYSETNLEESLEENQEIQVQEIVEEEVATEIVEQKQSKTRKPKTKTSKKAPPKIRGSEYGNSNDADAITAPTYLDLLQATVQERSAIPQEALEKQQFAAAVLRLSFNRNGYVQKYRLVKPTGYPALDQEALRVAESLTKKPFPPTPSSFDRGQPLLTYDFPISFDPRF